jgi:hypothetical protein
MTVEKKSGIRAHKSEQHGVDKMEKMSNGGRDDQQQDANAPKKTIIVKPAGGIAVDQPMLNPGRDGQPSNVHRCQEKWQNYIMYHFGEIGILFTALKYPKITRPRLKIAYLKDKSGILKNLYLDDFKCYIKKKERLREKKIATFAFIFGQMTEESKQICARDPKYDRAVLTQTCPLKLWNIILRTHLSEQTGHSLMNRFVARRAYETLRQDDGETLLNFKTRYEEALKTLKATGEKTPSDEDQAINFLEKLDQNKFAEFGAGLHNDAANKQEMGVPDTFPNTLAKMYAVASRYMVVVNKPRVPTGTVGTAAVFTATIAELDTIDRDDDRRPAATIKKSDCDEKPANDERHQAGNRTNKKKGDGGSRGEKQSEEGEHNRFPTGACLLCEEKGHKAFTCPKRDEVRAFLKTLQTDRDPEKSKRLKSALMAKKKSQVEWEDEDEMRSFF